MNKVIVTGANGFIGSYVCKELIDQGKDVLAVIKNKESDISNLEMNPHISILYCEMSDYSKLVDKIDSGVFDTLYHLAWEGVTGSDRGDYHIQLKNIEQTLNIIMIASELKCKRFVGVGSTAEYDAYNACREDGLSPNLVSLYGFAKISAHYMSKTLCNALGIEHIWAYLGNTYGVNDKGNNFINFASKQILSDKDAKFTSGEQYYDFVYVTDVAHGLYCIGEKGIDKKVYYVGSGNPRKLKEYILEMRDILNPRKELMLGAVPFNGVSSELSDYDIAKIKNDTGYEPKVTFVEGIKRVKEWVREKVDEEI